ncbi:MAG: hypothetical protein WAZ18_04055 [Alphaproteobacteria bacterium]
MKISSLPLPATVALGLTATAGAYMGFVHLMQTQPAFAEAVARISPALADATSCGCPFCTNQACLAALQPADNRLEILGDILTKAHNSR